MRGSICRLPLVLLVLVACQSSLTSWASGQDISRLALLSQLSETRGLCIQLGTDQEITQRLCKQDGILLHVLGTNTDHVVTPSPQRADALPSASVIVEQWHSKRLPHAENIANVIIVADPTLVTSDEVERVLSPGGVAFFQDGGIFRTFKKPAHAGTDQWTHQWHAADGGLTSGDERVGVPQGIQWLSGPLFAMAGRKSSTQTLVSSGGINFYVTQNVLENVGLPTLEQYLVARDAFNGLVLWQRKWEGTYVSGDGETNPRMVAGDDLLYVCGRNGIEAFDPATGNTRGKFELDDQIGKILLTDELLLAISRDRVVALSADLGAQLWDYSSKALSGLVVADEHAYLLSSGRSPDGSFQHDLVKLSVLDGAPIWKKNTQPFVTAARVRINFVQDGFIALQAHGSLHMYSSTDGEHLWTKKTEARPGKSYVDERYVGHFLRNGLVWMLMQNSPRESTGQNTWLGLDPESGRVERELTTQGNWPRTDTPAKMGCQVLLASDRYIMVPRQATFIDFDTGEKHSFKFARGGCGLGFVPANGLVYTHPHACGCFSEAIRGFIGMHSTKSVSLPSGPTASRLQTIAPTVVGNQQENPWPIHRHDGNRGSYSGTDLIGKLTPKWSAKIADDWNTTSGRAWKLRNGNRVSASTLAREKIYVADVDKGRIVALNQRNGDKVWEFDAASRIDSPPTISRGLCYFGAHDGYIYCLGADEGQLFWKFRAAPSDRRIVAYGSLESNWPVAGTVLVHEGIVYAAAGRAPDADGGIQVVALDALSGELQWEKRISGGEFRGLCDYLIQGDDAIYLNNYEFALKTGEVHATSESSHLTGGKAGLLEASWTKHDLALRKEIQTWTAGNISGQLLAISPEHAAAYNAELRQITITGNTDTKIQFAIPEQVTALALTNNCLVVAGGVDRADASAGGFLRIFSGESGKLLDESMLPSEAAFDSIAIRTQGIVVSTQSGTIHNFEFSN